VPLAAQELPAQVCSILLDILLLQSMANQFWESAILAATPALKITPAHAQSASLDFTLPLQQAPMPTLEFARLAARAVCIVLSVCPTTVLLALPEPTSEAMESVVAATLPALPAVAAILPIVLPALQATSSTATEPALRSVKTPTPPAVKTAVLAFK
jgi:hypothetical protein